MYLDKKSPAIPYWPYCQTLPAILGQHENLKHLTINETTLINRRYIWATILLTVLTCSVYGTTWSVAYPYEQQIDGQNVVVKAFPYDPYSGSPMIGVTRVYFNNKLLYSIDKYYREKIFTSDDGQYLVVVHTTNSAGITSYTTFGTERLDYDQTAIEVFKNGQPFKIFSLRDVVDTTKLANNGRFFYWGYFVDFEAFRKAEDGCESCKEVYSRKVLRTGDTSEIYANEWEECKRECDSAKLKKIEIKVSTNSIYVQNNSLIILTNQNVIVKLDFSEMAVQQIPFNTIVPDKKTFNPPKLNRKYKKVKLPDKFDEPNMKDGRSLEKGLADLFGLSILKNNEKGIFCVFIDHLVLDRNGKCVDFYGKVHDERISDYFLPESLNMEMTEKLNKWVMEQTFETKLMPKAFDRYSFLCIVHLK